MVWGLGFDSRGSSGGDGVPADVRKAGRARGYQKDGSVTYGAPLVLSSLVARPSLNLRQLSVP